MALDLQDPLGWFVAFADLIFHVEVDHYPALSTAYLRLSSCGRGPSKSQRFPSRSRNTATLPYGSALGAEMKLTPAAAIRS